MLEKVPTRKRFWQTAENFTNKLIHAPTAGMTVGQKGGSDVADGGHTDLPILTKSGMRRDPSIIPSRLPDVENLLLQSMHCLTVMKKQLRWAMLTRQPIRIDLEIYRKSLPTS